MPASCCTTRRSARSSNPDDVVIAPGGAFTGAGRRGGDDSTRHVPTARWGAAVGNVCPAPHHAVRKDYERVNLAQIVHNDADRLASLEK